MRVGMIAVAAAAVCAAVPAQAAVTVQVDATAFGFTTVSGPCGEKLSCGEPTSVSQSFSFTLAIDLALGQSYTFTNGPNSNAGVSTGTITRTGLQAYQGTDFQYLRSTPPGPSVTETRLTTSTFSVRQIIPAPVPEPATWAMMILGFGAIGYAMRRKTVLRFV